MNKLAFIIGGTPIPVISSIPSGSLYTTGRDAIQVGLNLFVLVGLILAVILIIYSGIQWATSQGDKTKVQDARNRLTYSIVGMLVIVLAFVIVRTVLVLIGANPHFFINTP